MGCRGARAVPSRSACVGVLSAAFRGSPPAPGAVRARMHLLPSKPSAPAFLEVRGARGGERSKMDTCCPERESGSAGNQAAGVRGRLLTPQGAALDAGSYGGFPPGPRAAPRPAAGRAGFWLQGRLLLSAAPRLEQPLPSLHTVGRGLPALRTPRRPPGSLSDEPVLMSGKSIVDSGLPVPTRPRRPRLCRPPSRQSHLWGEGRKRALMKPPAVPAAGRAPV